MKGEDFDFNSNNEMDPNFGKNMEFFKSKIIDTDKLYQFNAKSHMELHDAKKQIKLLQEKNKQQTQENLLINQQLKGLLSSTQPSENEQQREKIHQLQSSIEGYLDEIKSLNMTHKMLQDKINEMKAEENVVYMEQKLHVEEKVQSEKEIKELKKQKKLLERDNKKLKKKSDVLEERIRKLKVKGSNLHTPTDSSDKNFSIFSDSSQTSKLEESNSCGTSDSKFKSPLPGSLEKKKKKKKKKMRKREDSESMDQSESEEKEKSFQISTIKVNKQISIENELSSPDNKAEHFTIKDNMVNAGKEDNSFTTIKFISSHTNNEIQEEDTKQANVDINMSSESDLKTSQDEKEKSKLVITPGMQATLTKFKTERALKAFSRRIKSKQTADITNFLNRLNDDSTTTLDEEIKIFCLKHYLVGHEKLVIKKINKFFKDEMSSKVQLLFTPSMDTSEKNSFSENISNPENNITPNVDNMDTYTDSNIKKKVVSQVQTYPKLISTETTNSSEDNSEQSMSKSTKNIPVINESLPLLKETSLMEMEIKSVKNHDNVDSVINKPPLSPLLNKDADDQNNSNFCNDNDLETTTETKHQKNVEVIKKFKQTFTAVENSKMDSTESEIGDKNLTAKESVIIEAKTLENSGFNVSEESENTVDFSEISEKSLENVEKPPDPKPIKNKENNSLVTNKNENILTIKSLKDLPHASNSSKNSTVDKCSESNENSDNSAEKGTKSISKSLSESDNEEEDVTVNIKPVQTKQFIIPKPSRMRTRSISKSISEFSDLSSSQDELSLSLNSNSSKSINVEGVKNTKSPENKINSDHISKPSLETEKNEKIDLKTRKSHLVVEKPNLDIKNTDLNNEETNKKSSKKLKKRKSLKEYAAKVSEKTENISTKNNDDIVSVTSKIKSTITQQANLKEQTPNKSYASIPFHYGDTNKSKSSTPSNILKAVANHKRRMMEQNSNNIEKEKSSVSTTDTVMKPAVKKRTKSMEKSKTAPELNKIKKAMGGRAFELARGKRKAENVVEKSSQPKFRKVENDDKVTTKCQKLETNNNNISKSSEKLKKNKNKLVKDPKNVKKSKTPEKEFENSRRHPVLSTMMSFPFTVGHESPDNFVEDFSFAPESNIDQEEEQIDEDADLNECMNELQLKSIWDDIFFPNAPLSPLTFQPSHNVEDALTNIDTPVFSELTDFNDNADYDDNIINDSEERPSISPSANLCTAISFSAEASTSESVKTTKKSTLSKTTSSNTKTKEKTNRKRTNVSHLQDTPRRFSNETPILALSVPTIKPVTKALSFDPSMLSSTSQVGSVSKTAFKSFVPAEGTKNNENSGLGCNTKTPGAFKPLSLSLKEEVPLKNTNLKVKDDLLSTGNEENHFSNSKNLNPEKNSKSSFSKNNELKVTAPAPLAAKSLEESKRDLLCMFGGNQNSSSSSGAEDSVTSSDVIMAEMLSDIQSCGVIKKPANSFCPVVNRHVIRWLSYCLPESKGHSFEKVLSSCPLNKASNLDVILHPMELALVKTVVAVDKVRSIIFPNLVDELVLPTILKLINRYGCDYITYPQLFRDNFPELLSPFIEKNTKKFTYEVTASLLRIFMALARITGNVRAAADLCRTTVMTYKLNEVAKLFFNIVPCWPEIFQTHLPLSGKSMIYLLLFRAQNMTNVQKNSGVYSQSIRWKVVKMTKILGWDAEMPLTLEENTSSEKRWKPCFDICVQSIKNAKFVQVEQKFGLFSKNKVVKLSVPNFVDVFTCLETLTVMKGQQFVSLEIIDKTFWPMLHQWSSQLVENKTDVKLISNATMVAILRSLAVVLLVLITRQKAQHPNQPILVKATLYFETISSLLANFTLHFLDTAPPPVQCATFATVLCLSFCNPKSVYDVLSGWLQATHNKHATKNLAPHPFLDQITAFYIEGNIKKMVTWLQAQNSGRRCRASDKSITQLLFG